MKQERTELKMPAPWPGGKGRWAGAIWRRLDGDGRLRVYVEAFAGSLAVLLARRTPVPREIVCETDGLLSNWWRAAKLRPAETARHLTWPSDHLMLEARRRHLSRRAADPEFRNRLSDDPAWCDPVTAAYYTWVVSNEVGAFRPSTTYERDPEFRGNRPYLVGIGTGGRGVQAQREAASGPGPDPWENHQAFCRDILERLARRLFRVTILHRSWEKGISKVELCQGEKGTKPPAGVFLDPPYRTDEGNRSATNLYESDRRGTSTEAAVASYKWAVEHGARIRIAYCCREGDFPIPQGWTAETRAFPGVTGPEQRERNVDMVMFSPACCREKDLPVGPLGL